MKLLFCLGSCPRRLWLHLARGRSRLLSIRLPSTRMLRAAFTLQLHSTCIADDGWLVGWLVGAWQLTVGPPHVQTQAREQYKHMALHTLPTWQPAQLWRQTLSLLPRCPAGQLVLVGLWQLLDSGGALGVSHPSSACGLVLSGVRPYSCNGLWLHELCLQSYYRWTAGAGSRCGCGCLGLQKAGGHLITHATTLAVTSACPHVFSSLRPPSRPSQWACPGGGALSGLALQWLQSLRGLRVNVLRPAS